MGIHDDDVAAVRAAADIVQVVSEYTPLRRQGQRWVGLCPFHTERTPSFSVNANENLFYCFGCQASGDVISFVMDKEALDFPAAVERLASKTGISLRYTDRSEGEGRKRRARYLDAMARAVEWYHQRLLSGSDAGPARSYLRARGLDGDVVRDFRIGWAPAGWDELTRALRLDKDLAEGTGLARLNRRGRLNDHFRARILFPIGDDRGDPISFGGRILPGEEGPGNQGKYKNTTETPLYNKSKVLYGLDRAKTAIVSSGTAVICEGYTDVIGFHRAGVPLAVATCGTALTDDHVRLLTRFAARRLVLAFDADAAGQAAAERFYAWEREHDIEVLVADLPPGQDPADVAFADPERLAAAVDHDKATKFLRFRLDRVFDAADLTSAEGRARAAERALEIVAEHPTDLVRDEYLMDVASRCRFEPDKLRPLLDEVRSRPPAERRSTTGSGARGRRRAADGPRDERPPHPGEGRSWSGTTRQAPTHQGGASPAPDAARPVANQPDDLAVDHGAIAGAPGGSSSGGDGRARGRPGGARAARRDGPAVEALRHAVHDPGAVGRWLVADLFDDPVHRGAFQALLDAVTHTDALAHAPPEVADLLAQLLAVPPESEPFDAVRLLHLEVARREIAASRLAGVRAADGTQALADLVQLTRLADGLRSTQSAAASAEGLLAWLADQAHDGG
jgi:DNA primase